MATFRKGDTVSVTGKVRHNLNAGEDFIYIDVDGHHMPLILKPDEVTLVAPRIDVGEHVRWTNGHAGIVIAAADGFLWVHKDNGQRVTWPAKEVAIIAADPVIFPETPPMAPEIGEPAEEAV